MDEPEIAPPRWPILLPRLAHYLPAGLFNQLQVLPQNLEQLNADEHSDIVRDLLRVNRTLEPLHRVLIQYMPRYLSELDPTPGQPHGELLKGSFIFADVTGFTALTELLARQGQARGHELMNQIMNRLFTEILDPLIASGGDLLIFAGDAALVFFPQQDKGHDVLQATRAALRMERAIVPFESFETEFGQCSLTMSAGVEHGLVYAGVVGAQRRMELLVNGPGIAGAMQAEVQAEPGQVMLGPQAQAIARKHFTMNGARVVDDLGETLGDYEISIPTRKRGSSVVLGMDIPEILETVEASLQRVEQLAPFLPEDMLAHMVNADQRHRKLVSEFRPVAVQFVNIVGLEALAITRGPEFATAVFQRYFVQAQEIINQHEGVISQVDAYAQGFFLLNTFGAPKAHEGTPRYAVSAALQLDKLLHQINQDFELETPLQQRGGITYGLVFNGEIGAKYRRESVVAGPAVNRAARLMSKAQFGQVILDAKIWEDTSAAFVGEHLPAVQLKGIKGAVVIVNVHEVRRGTRLQSLERPLLGRQAEQAELDQALRALSELQQSSAWMISGETGIGKTSLILDLAEKARRNDLTILTGRCQPHGKHIPLFVWIDLLTGWLDVDESTDLTKQRARLAGELASLGMSDAQNVVSDLLALSKSDQAEAAADGAGGGLGIAQVGGGLPLSPPHRTPDMKPDKEGVIGAADETGLHTHRMTPSRSHAEHGNEAGVIGEQKAKPETVPTEPPQPQGIFSALLGNRLAQPQQKSGKTLWKRLEERISGLRVVIKLLGELAKRRPGLIILEDVHWLDRDSEMLLNKLLAQAPDLPLVLVLTGRRPIDGNNLLSMELSGLSNLALTQVAQRVFGAQALDNSLAEWVCNQANGNPLYAKELCCALQRADAVLLDRETGEVRWTKQAPTLPLSLHELMLARLDELPLPQQNVLKRAAVIGEIFEYEGLLKLYPPRSDKKEIAAAMEYVIRAGFLTETQQGTFCFNHPLMQEAIYTTLSFSQRQDWHTKIGNWLIERQIEQALELIAYHYLHGNNTKKAAEFGRLAGDRARAHEAYAGALEYYAQVLAMKDAPAKEKMAAVEGQADVLMLQGDYSAAEQTYAKAIKLGSSSARGKQAILSGNLEQLAQTEFSPALQAWNEGSRAYLLAQAGQFETALISAQTALKLAESSAKKVMESLVQRLKNREILEPYEQWLKEFTETVLL